MVGVVVTATMGRVGVAATPSINAAPMGSATSTVMTARVHTTLWGIEAQVELLKKGETVSVSVAWVDAVLQDVNAGQVSEGPEKGVNNSQARQCGRC